MVGGPYHGHSRGGAALVPALARGTVRRNPVLAPCRVWTGGHGADKPVANPEGDRGRGIAGMSDAH